VGVRDEDLKYFHNLLQQALDMDRFERLITLGVLMTAVAIKEGMPELRGAIEAGLKKCEERLAELGKKL
jgi:hypothetical protein